MKDKEHLTIGTPLALPDVPYAKRVGIVKVDSPFTTPYASKYVEVWLIEINPKTGMLQCVGSGVFPKAKVERLIPQNSRDENLLMCELEG